MSTAPDSERLARDGAGTLKVPARSQDGVSGRTMVSPGLAMLMDLQRSAGNGAVAGLFRPRAITVQRSTPDEDETPADDEATTTPAPDEAPAPEQGATPDESPTTAEGSAPSDAGGAGASPSGGDPDADAGEPSPEDQARKEAEVEGLSDTDPTVDMGGGAPPYAAPGGGFHDGGRVATVPFGESASCLLDAAPDHPHAFTGGGRAGGAKWSGGGPAGGPKGNQGTGSLQGEVPPAYDTRSNGPVSKADAWVRAGTGRADVTRNYSASDAGDQGNGWWISPAAASYLEAHEQRHVEAARNVYTSTIGSMDDRVAKSESYGKGAFYWARDAITYVSNYVAWERTLKEFKEQDAQWNANQGEVDQRDLGSGGYPRNQKGPRKIAGKDYDNYLVKPGEEPPA